MANNAFPIEGVVGIGGILGIILASTLLGCGTDVRPMTGDDEGAVPTDSGDEFTPPAGYTRLIGRTWELPAGANIYKCVRVTVPVDTYITNFVAQSPVGTHHSVLSIAGANGTAGPDGEEDCTATSIGMNMVYASAVGTAPLQLPDGVGIKIEAGKQLHLNLHLYNTSDEDVRGESAVWIKTQPTPPATLAELVLAGPLEINVPADGQPHEVSGTCTAQAAYTLFAVWPHMHLFGTHQTVELVDHAGTAKAMLHDAPYRFDDQSYDVMSPMANIAAGDVVRVTCTYVNATNEVVTYGDGAGKEMCFAGLYRYPAVGSNEYCPE